MKSLTTAILVLFALVSGPAGAANYEIDVNLAVKHHADMPGHLGSSSPLEDVRVRLMAKTKIGWYAVWDTQRTNEHGHVSFSKDKNTKKRRFRVKVMFRDSDLEIRQGDAAKPGTRKVKWYTVREFGWTGRNETVDRTLNLTFGQDSHGALDDREPRYHAEIWTLYHTTIDHFADEYGSDYGFQKKVKVKYPHDTPLIGNVTASYANPHNKVIYLYKDSSGDAGRQPLTMIHELMHVWVYRQVRAERKLAGYLVANGTTHGALKKQFVAFHEGVAEWTALKVLEEVFKEGMPHAPRSNHWIDQNIPFRTDDDLVVQGGAWKNVPRHDKGWEYILNLISRPDVYKYNFGTSDDRLSRTRTAADLEPLVDCHGESLSFRELLDVFVKGSDWHTRDMNWDGFWSRVINQDNGLHARNKRHYRTLTDPKATSGEIDRVICMGRAKQAANEGSDDDGGTGGGIPGGAGFDRPGQQTDLPEKIKDPGIDARVPEIELAVDFEGRWQTQYGELNLHQIDGYIIGDYADAGVMLGKVTGNCVAGVFTNGERNGVFRFNKNGKDAFSGQWAWHGDRPTTQWDGKRAGQADAELINFTPDNQSLRTRDNARKAFDGTYDSRFGQVKLKQRDLFLIGDYGDKGIIAGLWDGNSFRGHFTNEGRTGWFDFAFLSKNGSFQDGEWNWVGSDAPREWRLDKAADATPTLDNVTADIRCSG